MPRTTDETSRRRGRTAVDLEGFSGCATRRRRRRRGPPDAPSWPPRPWPDCSVRRIVDADVDEVRRMLRRRLGPVAPAWPGEYRAISVVHAGPWRTPVPVELVVTAWARDRTEIRIEVRTIRIPDGYFELAHCVADALAAEAGSRAAPR